MSEMPLYDRSARELARAIRHRDVSSVEVVRAHLDRIEELDADVGAFLGRVPDSEVMATAREADAAVARGDALGVLHGLPTGVKDLVDVAGLVTSQGSAAYADSPPAARDSVLAANLRRAGAIIVGKTATPEFGLGTLTFNDIRGVARNPWDLDRHAGGSSGGAAAAVAARMLPFADGSDSGGSIRYPASFCNVVGLRPTAGLVPSGRSGNAWDPHGVLGPMARDSRDAALLLAGIAGRDDGWPLSWHEHPGDFATLDDIEPGDVTLGWSADVGGLPIDPGVRAAMAAARGALEAAGVRILDVEPDLRDADAAWQAIELFAFAADGVARVAEHGDRLGADYRRNVREGAALTATEYANALAHRTVLYRRTAETLRRVDAVVYPGAPVVAPPADIRWVDEIDGERFDRYFLWQRVACRLTATAHPVLATPAGFTAEGLPVGMQVLGPDRQDRRLLSIGAMLEDVLGHVRETPSSRR